jgi:hypothetical protein
MNIMMPMGVHSQELSLLATMISWVDEILSTFIDEILSIHPLKILECSSM